MAQEIEGAWNGFKIRLVTSEDQEVLQKHLIQNFYRDEPLCNLMGYSDDLAKDFMQIWITFISHNLSLVALDEETNEVAGVRITLDHPKGFDWSVYKVTSWQMRTLLQILGMAEEKANVYETCNVDRYADWFLVSVEKKYRGQGLAQELYQRSINLAREKKLPLVKCIFSSPYSRKAGANLGFQELSAFYVTEALDENGETLLPNAAPNQKVTLGVFKLQ
jgi:GNAT superfamily N-acetyltransferase